MVSVFNKIFYVLKFILLIVAFALSLYITIYMYHRLDKSLMASYTIFLPYILIFIIYCINSIIGQKRVNNNIFYNLTSCLVFSLIIFVSYRAICDTFMIAHSRLGYNINFNYFNDFIIPMKIMLYGLIITNILLMVNFKNKEVLARKV